MEEEKTGKRKIYAAVALLGLAGLFLYLAPPFHLVPLDAARLKKQSETFDHTVYARRFWNDRLMHSLDRAVDAVKLLEAIDRSPEAAQRYAQKPDLGSVYYFFAMGQGRVVAIEDDHAALSLRGDPATPDILIATDHLVGNTIAKSTGLMELSSFTSSRDFNIVSQKINAIVTAEVIPPFLRDVTVGSRVGFVGCAQIRDEDKDLRPLRLIPIQLKIP
jgi:predicted lipoprotein